MITADDYTVTQRVTWTPEDLEIGLSDDDGAIVSAAEVHTGAMIALVPSQADIDRIAVPDGEDADELHLTLAYLGDAADIPEDVRETIIEVVADVATSHQPLGVDGFSVSMFNPPGSQQDDDKDRDSCVVLGVSGDGLVDVHDEITDRIEDVMSSNDVEYPEQHAPWIPHVTLLYTDDADLSYFTDRAGPITFDTIRVAFAGETFDVPLGDDSPLIAKFDPTQPRDDDGQWTDSPTTVLKSVVKKLIDGGVKTQGDLYDGIEALDQDQWDTLTSEQRNTIIDATKSFRGKNAPHYHKELAKKIDELNSKNDTSLKKTEVKSSSLPIKLSRRKAQAMMKDMLIDDPWSDEDKEVILEYTEEGYAWINTSMRSPEQDLTPHITQAMVSDVNATLRPIPTAIKVYRRVELEAFGSDVTINNVADLVGQTRQDPAFLSTSIISRINPQLFGNVLMELDVPTGVRGAYVESISKLGEYEMLLEAGLRLHITDVQVHGQEVRVKVTVER